MEKELPLYELRIDPKRKSLVNAIALVEDPAIQSDFFYFSNQKELHFKADDEKQELIGLAMIPDLKIYRRNLETDFEYNVVFTKETIRDTAKTFFQNGFQSNLNLNHTVTPAGSYIFQSYIVDLEKGINAPKGLQSIDGSWVVGVKVEDKSVWEQIKAGTVKGFSIEGIFEIFELNENKEDGDDEILSMLHQINKLLEKK